MHSSEICIEKFFIGPIFYLAVLSAFFNCLYSCMYTVICIATRIFLTTPPECFPIMGGGLTTYKSVTDTQHLLSVNSVLSRVTHKACLLQLDNNSRQSERSSKFITQLFVNCEIFVFGPIETCRFREELKH